MAYIITLANQKGGTGKTTICTNVAHALALEVGADKVLVIDADPQASIIHWAARRGNLEFVDVPFAYVANPSAVLHQTVQKQLGRKFKYILIDTPARITDIPRSAIAAADLVLVVTRPSTYDIDACKPTIEFIQESAIYKEKPVKSFYVINDKDPRTRYSFEAILPEMLSTGLTYLEPIITTRDIFAICLNKGLTIFEYMKNDESHTQIKALTREILKHEKQSSNANIG